MRRITHVRKKLKNTLVKGLYQKLMTRKLDPSNFSASDEISDEDLERLRKKLEKSKQPPKKPAKRRVPKIPKKADSHDDQSASTPKKRRKKSRCQEPVEVREKVVEPQPQLTNNAYLRYSFCPEPLYVTNYQEEEEEIDYCRVAEIRYEFETSHKPASLWDTNVPSKLRAPYGLNSTV